MRRTLAILASPLPPLLSLPLVPFVLFARADAAGAHACALPVQVAVGEPATVTVGVTAEADAVTAVEVRIPAGFRLTGAAADGWNATTQGDVVRFDGDRVDPFSCGYVTIDGVADERAKLAFPLTLLTATGDAVTYDSATPYCEDSAQLVYAGLDLPALPVAQDDGAGAFGVGRWALVGAGTVLALLTAAGWLRSRRPVPEPDAVPGNSPGRGDDL